MKVQFDSNTWRQVVDPEKFSSDSNYNDYKKIHDAIDRGKIDAYLSETMFTVEAIVRKKRQGYFADMSPKVTQQENCSGKEISMRLVLGPNEDDFVLFDNTTQTLKYFFDKAVALNFHIVRLPRIGGIVNPEVEQVLFKIKDNFNSYFEKATIVSEKIENNGAGFMWLKAIGNQYDDDWLKGIKLSPKSECKKIAKAAAEWADGESIAISIGLECDYFCTHDKAKGAGKRSVFSQKNIAWLKNDYNFTTISIPELAALL